MFSIFDNSTGKRVSEDSYATADEANHDYCMNAGSTHVGVISKPTDLPSAYEQDASHRRAVHAGFWDGEPLTAWQEFILCRELNCAK
jgi:hypothetical protein